MSDPPAEPKRPLFGDNEVTRALQLAKGPFMFVFIANIATNILYMALPVFTTQVYGRVLQSQSQETLFVLGVGTLFAFIIMAVLEALKGATLIGYGLVFDRALSQRVLGAMFDAALKGDPAGRSQALRDMDNVKSTATGGAIMLFVDLPFVPLFMIVLFVIDPVIGLITMIGGIILLALAWLQDRATRPTLKMANDAALKSYAYSDGALRNGEVVRAMGLSRPWSAFRAVAGQRGAEASDRGVFYTNLIKFVRMSIQILVIGVGAWLVVRGNISPGLIFANMILSGKALQPLERAVGSWNMLLNGHQAYQRLSSLLEAYPAAAKSTTLPRPKGELAVEELTYASPRGGRPPLISDLSFVLPAGETLGVVGPSGAGKSTLTRLLMGVLAPTSGRVRLDGADVYTWDRTDFGRYVGYLPQDVELFSGTARDNIARFYEDATDADVVEAAQLAGAHPLILSLPNGYETELGDGGVGLSAGQRQRIGLARALLGAPAFVVLDEPNANLDAEGENALIAAMATMKARGQTLVIVSHKPNVFRGADKMLVLRDGKLEMYGPREKVLARILPQAARPVEAQS
jgi:ATP-binding cassette subfamily C exporter for protease/lipase